MKTKISGHSCVYISMSLYVTCEANSCSEKYVACQAPQSGCREESASSSCLPCCSLFLCTGGPHYLGPLSAQGRVQDFGRGGEQPLGTPNKWSRDQLLTMWRSCHFMEISQTTLKSTKLAIKSSIIKVAPSAVMIWNHWPRRVFWCTTRGNPMNSFGGVDFFWRN